MEKYFSNAYKYRSHYMWIYYIVGLKEVLFMLMVGITPEWIGIMSKTNYRVCMIYDKDCYLS